MINQIIDIICLLIDVFQHSRSKEEEEKNTSPQEFHFLNVVSLVFVLVVVLSFFYHHLFVSDYLYRSYSFLVAFYVPKMITKQIFFMTKFHRSYFLLGFSSFFFTIFDILSIGILKRLFPLD